MTSPGHRGSWCKVCEASQEQGSAKEAQENGQGEARPEHPVPSPWSLSSGWASPSPAVPLHIHSQRILPRALKPPVIPGQMHTSQETPSAPRALPHSQPSSPQHITPHSHGYPKSNRSVPPSSPAPSCWQHDAAKHERQHEKAIWPLFPSLLPLMASSSTEKKAGWEAEWVIAQGG